MNKKLLVVAEGNDVKQLLKNNGYAFIVVPDAYQAMSLALSEKPDLIIMDVMMPACGGYGLYDNLRKSSFTAQTPVIFIVENVDDALKTRVRNNRTVDYLVKPTSGPELLRKIRRLLPDRKEPPLQPPIYEIEI